MSRFLFSTFGSLGDLHPYIAIARELNKRGHTTVIATLEEYRAAVNNAGSEFAAVPPSAAEMGDYRVLVQNLFDLRRGPEFLLRQMVMPYLRPAYDRLWQASDGADLLISHPLTMTLPLVAQCRNLPWVSTVLSPMSLMSSVDPPVMAAAPWLKSLGKLGLGPYRLLFNLLRRTVWSWEAPLRDFRAELGLPPSNQMALFEGQFSPLLTLALFDSQLAGVQPDWPSNTRICGSPLFDDAEMDDATTRGLENFLSSGEAPIVFALGSSAVWIAGDFWDKAVAAVQHMGRRAILITGPTTPTTLPENVAAFPYLPYSKVFPRAAVIVHQAGIGTLAQAMRSGRPQLITPIAFDQPDNAFRARSLGLGRILPFRKVTVARLISDLDSLLLNPDFAVAARSIAGKLAPTNGAAVAADELTACLRHTEVKK